MLAAACFNTYVFAGEPVNALPGVDFLEYLADMQEIDGEWVSPVDLQQQNIENPMQTDETTIAQDPTENDPVNKHVDDGPPSQTQEKTL
jgi:hypothetical protein